MIKSEWTGKNVEQATQKGLKEMGLNENQADIEILSEGGFLKQAKVLISKKQTEGEKAAEFLQQLLDKMKFNYIVELTEEGEEIKLDLIGTESGAVIGRRGEVLDALQYIVSLAVSGEKKGFRRVVVDSENYRQKRSDNLIKLAKNLEKKVERTDRYVKLEPMNPFERRVIHSALQDSLSVKTTSVGEEPNRYVVIYPKDRPFVERERRENRENTGQNRRGGQREGDRRSFKNGQGEKRQKSTPYKEEEAPRQVMQASGESGESSFSKQRKKLSFVYRSDKKKRRK